MSGDTFGCPSWRVEARGPITAHKAQGGPHKEDSSSTKCPRFRGREAESQTHGMVPNFPLDSDPGRSAWTAASATRKTADDCNGAESRASTKRRRNRSGTRGPAGGAASTWPQVGRAGRAFAFLLCKRSWPGLVVETATEGQPGLPLEPGFGNEWKAPRLPSRLIGSQNTPEGQCVQAVASLVPAVTWPQGSGSHSAGPTQPASGLRAAPGGTEMGAYDRVFYSLYFLMLWHLGALWTYRDCVSQG